MSKNFMIRCRNCKWGRATSGITSDLEDLHEIKVNCTNCGRWRKFRCPKCGNNAVMRRVRGNSELESKE